MLFVILYRHDLAKSFPSRSSFLRAKSSTLFRLHNREALYIAIILVAAWPMASLSEYWHHDNIILNISDVTGIDSFIMIY